MRTSFFGLDLKPGRETLSLAFPGSGMRQSFRWRPSFNCQLIIPIFLRPFDREATVKTALTLRAGQEVQRLEKLLKFWLK